MRKTLFYIQLFALCCTKGYTQPFVFKSVNKQLKEYTEKYDFSTPLDAYVSFQYLLANGKNSKIQSVSSYKLQSSFHKNRPDIFVSEKYKNELLNRRIIEIITYKDSVAATIASYADSFYVFQYFNLENNQWRSGGEDLANGLPVTREKVMKNLPVRLNALRKIIEIQNFPSDTANFVNYLKNYGKEPKQFILDALSKHKIVIYGEIHRRKVSWQLMKDLIHDPSFPKTTGSIFMELSSDKQGALNQFFNSKKLNTEIILNIFREFQLNGWYDKGSYEFLISLWKLNQSLPEKEKIRVILTDIPMPLSLLKTKEDYRNFRNNLKDRNEQMADIIEYTIKTSSDKRNNLFIVGEGHASKSAAIATEGEAASRNPNAIYKHSAAFQLTERFSRYDVFSIISHSPGVTGLIRGGMFDYAFACIGNKPTAFHLQDSPFGKEVFDAFAGIAYKLETGNFENNYDGYVFLCPLEKEEADYLLYELVTDDFVGELKRRTALLNAENEKWFGIENKNLTKKAIIKDLKNSTKSNKRWKNI
ncbi:MAG: hypothetical protein LBG15_06740 [Dysgonamonadaceae bacterium]|jgi:hypothetical protein|nr:hypothetical protein [Dysgonamonadaceae bacterium]